MKCGGDCIGPAEFEAVGDVAHGGAGVVFVDAAFEAGEELESFKGIFFDAGAEGLFEDGVKIDEEAGAEHAVDFFFARGVQAHEIFECAGFVAAEVVDVHGGKFFAARDDEIDEPLEAGFFFGGCVRPDFFVAQLSVGVFYSDAEKILQAGIADEGVAFEIDEDVAV